MKIAVGCDHAGLPLMEEVRKHLTAGDFELLDFGTRTADSVDYPDFAHKVAAAVAGGAAEKGVLVCGTGIGISMAANRHSGVRAALCTDAYMAKMARNHNDANILCMGARVIGAGVALDIVDAFFSSEFEGGRHQRRIEKIEPDSFGGGS